MTEDSNINFNNMFQNSHNLTTLQTIFNNTGSEGQNVMEVQAVTLEGKYLKIYAYTVRILHKMSKFTI